MQLMWLVHTCTHVKLWERFKFKRSKVCGMPLLQSSKALTEISHKHGRTVFRVMHSCPEAPTHQPNSSRCWLCYRLILLSSGALRNPTAASRCSPSSLESCTCCLPHPGPLSWAPFPVGTLILDAPPPCPANSSMKLVAEDAQAADL